MITEKQYRQIEDFVQENKEETLKLLKELTTIPAPTGHEEQKAAFVWGWLQRIGAEGAFIDEAGNVVFSYGSEQEAVVFMAHLDVVFPDMEPFTVVEEGEKLFAPGILDDNANLANMLMCVKFLLRYKPVLPVTLIFVANVCEEGLGNLKGSKFIYDTFGPRIREFIGFDASINRIVNQAVGSQRYRITVKTEGGHSYNAFGNDNAIHKLSCIIQSLYQVKVPEQAKTTYNIGMIEGGTSVNTIPQSAAMLYEFRSEEEACLAVMEQYFNDVITFYKEKECLDVQVEILGIRPCGKGVDEKQQEELTQRNREIIGRYTQGAIIVENGSTDANTFLAHGIASNVIGTAIGARTHTRGEWMFRDSMIAGQKVALASVVWYFG